VLYITIIIVFLSVWGLVSILLISLFNKEKPINKLKYLDEDINKKEKGESINKKSASLIKYLSKLLPNLKFNEKKVKKLEKELIKADIPITLEELLVIKILSSSSFVLLAFIFSKNYLIILVVIIIIWNIPRVIISRKKKNRVKLFDSQLNEGINIISNSLKAGYSFLQAVAVVSDETTEPFSKEFKKLLKEMSLGITEEESLKNLLFRMESEDLRLIINAILIQKDIGGNLSEILDNISQTIRERQKIKNELKTLTAQGKLSGIIVMLLPIFLGVTIYFFNKEYTVLLFTTTMGRGMIIASIFSQLLGFFMIRKIINIDM
jgi:tight adherence protein B